MNDFQLKEQSSHKRSQTTKLQLMCSAILPSLHLLKCTGERAIAHLYMILKQVNMKLAKREENKLSVLTASQASQCSRHYTLFWLLSPHPRHYYILKLFQRSQTSSQRSKFFHLPGTYLSELPSMWRSSHPTLSLLLGNRSSMLNSIKFIADN